AVNANQPTAKKINALGETSMPCSQYACTIWHASGGQQGLARASLEHDPEKWVPVFGKRSCSTKKLERDDDSNKSHPALLPPFLSNPESGPRAETRQQPGEQDRGVRVGLQAGVLCTSRP